MNPLTATEHTDKVRTAVIWWWHRALRFDCVDVWEHTVSHLHGAIMIHPDPAIRDELRALRDLASEHIERCEARDRADLDGLLDGITMLQHQAD